MFENAVALLASQPLLFASILGLLVGSFLNVVILRLPKQMQHEWTEQCHDWLKQVEQEKDSTPAVVDKTEQEQATSSIEAPPGIAAKGSHCPKCKASIKPWHNIPVISYLALGGKCANCKAKIPLRYPLVELLTAILSALVIHHFGITLQGGAALFLTWCLIALSFIDFDHQLLPDNIVLPALWLGLLLNLGTAFTSINHAVIGAAAGYMSLWSIFQLFKLLTGKEGMGYGDFKLLALFGAWLGWQVLPQIIFISTMVGSIVGITLIASKKINREKPIPFGPYIAIAGFIALLWGGEINTLYLSTLN